MSEADSNDARRERAAKRRRTIALRWTTHAADEPATIRREAALSLVATLTRAAWSLSGKPLPQYSRAETPYLFVAAPSKHA